MILRPKPSVRLPGALPGIAAVAPAAPVPSWLRRSVEQPQTREDAAHAAGAALGILDALVRRQERWAGVWRQRLALAAAAATARQAGRSEDEAALRDALFLTHQGGDVGPGGRILLAWRRLAVRPTGDLLTKADLAAVLEEYGHAPDDETTDDLVNDLHRLAAADSIVAVLPGAFASAERHKLGRSFGCWLADALLARKLGWPHAVPLFCTGGGPTGSRSRTGGLTERDSTALLAAQARAALSAVDLSVELARRAERLIAVAPRLRAKGADLVVGKLLSDDAVVASQPVAGMSDRGLRRLSDRLVDLGALRELSGRSSFRLYGL